MQKIYTQILPLMILSLTLLVSCKEDPKVIEPTQSEAMEQEVAQENSSLAELNDEILNNPESPNGYYKRALYYKDQFEFDNAIADINRALKLTPEVPALTFAKADILFHQAGANQNPQLYEQAEIYLLETISLDSTHVEAQVLEARINMSKPNFEKAIYNLNSALLTDKYYAPAYFWKGMIFELEGKRELAKSSYQTAIEVDANYYDALHHLGNMLALDYDESARTYYDAALELEPNSFEVLRNKGLFLKDMEDYAGAYACFNILTSGDSTCEECYFNLANVYVASFRDEMTGEQKDTTLQGAIDNFKTATEINPNYIDAFYNLGYMYEFKGDNKKAIEYYQQALVLEPAHEPSLEGLKRM